MSGSSQTLRYDCPNCGAQLEVHEQRQDLVCRYCGVRTPLPQELWQRFNPQAAQVPTFVPVPVPASSGGGATIIMITVGVIVGAVAIIGAVVANTSSGASMSERAALKPIAAAGDACGGRRAACAADKKAQLACGPGDKMIVSDTCKGPGGCAVAPDGTTISCDRTLADAGDPCSGSDAGCAVGHRAELRCQAGHYAVVATCKGHDGCTVKPTGNGYTLSCDDHIADTGDPCFDNERTACSSDKKWLLTCTAQRFAVHSACKKGCSVTKLVGTGKTEMRCE
jgi:hypothetical protein